MSSPRKNGVSETTPLMSSPINMPAVPRKGSMTLVPPYKRDHHSVHPSASTKWEYNMQEGSVYHMQGDLLLQEAALVEDRKAHQHLLSELPATAICANDITSSCLYVIGLVCANAGVYAPLCCLLAVLVLYLYKSIYTEVVGALPLNGGTFNVLLHTTSKRTAAFASIMAILSYVATGVVSASEAVHYLHTIAHTVPITEGTICLLGFFALLNLIGINESANFAVLLFAFHIFTLTCLISACIWLIFHTGLDMFWWNYSQQTISLTKSLFYGFSAAMLGVSGFESSSQYVEEQAKGVFPKTLRNMWTAVAIINPVLSSLAICMVDVSLIESDPSLRSTVLATLAEQSGGNWLKMIVSVDAFTVLAGAVLTAFVGSTGLIRRLSHEGCLPEFLLTQNKFRGTNHTIIIGFFLVCSSMFLILDGNVDVLSRVYSVCFMGLMIMFAIGAWLVKWKRKTLLQGVLDKDKSTWATALIAPMLVFIAFISTIVKAPDTLSIFALYASVVSVFVLLMLFRFQSLRVVYYTVHAISRFFKPSKKVKIDAKIDTLTSVSSSRATSSTALSSSSLSLSSSSSNTLANSRNVSWTNTEDDDDVGTWAHYISDMSTKIKHRPFVFFASKPRADMLNKAVLYVRENEVCDWIQFVHFYGFDDGRNIQEGKLHDDTMLPFHMLQPLTNKCDCFLTNGRSNNVRRMSSLDHAVSCSIHQQPKRTTTLDEMYGVLLKHEDLREQLLNSFPVENTPSAFATEQIIMLIDQIRVLDQCYPKLCLDLVLIHAPFNPATITALSTQIDVPISRMFMSCPENRFRERIRDVGAFGGVRVITR